MAPDAGWEAHILDSSAMHAHAAGARKASGEQAFGRSRGGFSTRSVGRAPLPSSRTARISPRTQTSIAWHVGAAA